MRINHNISSMNALRQLHVSSNDLQVIELIVLLMTLQGWLFLKR